MCYPAGQGCRWRESATRGEFDGAFPVCLDGLVQGLANGVIPDYVFCDAFYDGIGKVEDFLVILGLFDLLPGDVHNAKDVVHDVLRLKVDTLGEALRGEEFGQDSFSPVSRICVGCMSYGKASEKFHQWTLGPEDTQAMVKHAIDLGVNFFDTANIYSFGTSEEYLGRALKNIGIARDKVMIASKVFFNEGRLSREASFGLLFFQ